MVVSSLETFTIKVVDTPGNGDPSTHPTLECPGFSLVDHTVECTGTTPEPNQIVWIELDKTLIDKKIGSGKSDSSSKFVIPITFDDIGYHSIHAEIDVVLWLNKTSESRKILVLNYMVFGLIGIVLLVVAWKTGLLKKFTKGSKK